MSPSQNYLDAHRDRFLAELIASCRIPSVSGQAEGLETMKEWVDERLLRLGCRVEAWPVAGGPAIVWAEIGEGERSLLSYSHYDVQPADPLDLWLSPPFAPEVREGKIFARGVCDDKGDFMARIHAIEVYKAVYGDLPFRFKFFIEGEEETGSPHLTPVAAVHADDLRADACLWESGEFDSQDRYRVFLGVKGIQYVELRLRGAKTDLHSAYATIVPNAAWRLVQALNTLKAPDDRITLDGFMDHVRPLIELEETYLDRIPFDGDGLKTAWGVPAFIGDAGDREALRRFLYAPTCTICGLLAGFTGEGTKTVLPATAMAKLDFRLVPDLTPTLVLTLLRQHLDRRGYSDIEIAPLSATEVARSNPSAAIVGVVAAAAREVYGHEPVIYPSHGGSGPMYPLTQGLGVDAVTVGVGYSGANIHAPNENIRLDDYFRHVLFLVELFRRFAGAQ